MTELIDNPPPLPDAGFYVWSDGANGIPKVSYGYTADQYRAGEAAAFARGVAAGRNAGLEEAAKPKKKFAWECNECGSQEYTMSVSESDVQQLGCGNCGANEWHKAEEK